VGTAGFEDKRESGSQGLARSPSALCGLDPMACESGPVADRQAPLLAPLASIGFSPRCEAGTFPRMRTERRPRAGLKKVDAFLWKVYLKIYVQGCVFLNLSQRLDFRYPPPDSACLKSCLFVWIGQSEARINKLCSF
jgi:hypothetical protein